MRIQYQSDLHLEFCQNNISYSLPEVDADVIVLAGDIGMTKPKYFDWVLRQTHDIPTVMVLGNHESYGTSIQRALRKWKEATAGSHVHILDNSQPVIIDDVRFLGGTLWTDFSLLGAETRELAMRTVSDRMNDYKKIRYEKNGAYRSFTPEYARQLHYLTRSFIERELATEHQHGPTVVVTHHAPCLGSVPLSAQNDLLATAYASDLSELIVEYQPQLWIHGHIHNNTDLRIGQTKVLSNPRGYQGSEINPQFDPNSVVIV